MLLQNPVLAKLLYSPTVMAEAMFSSQSAASALRKPLQLNFGTVLDHSDHWMRVLTQHRAKLALLLETGDGGSASAGRREGRLTPSGLGGEGVVMDYAGHGGAAGGGNANTNSMDDEQDPRRDEPNSLWMISIAKVVLSTVLRLVSLQSIELPADLELLSLDEDICKRSTHKKSGAQTKKVGVIFVFRSRGFFRRVCNFSVETVSIWRWN